jgi:hypothetical protein
MDIKNMKTSYYLVALGAIALCNTANGGSAPKRFTGEIKSGLDIVSASYHAENDPTPAPGELGLAIYETISETPSDETKLYIPTTMYTRLGGGINIPFGTDRAKYFGTSHDTKNGYTVQIGLGWNLSSYVRTEIDFQNMAFQFEDLTSNQRATYNTIGGMLYFDLARRYIQSGDITYRRSFVPFIGVGAGFGTYEFQGASGADGAVIAAPRATIGFNIMLSDTIGIDVAYQYQMMIGNGFGWDTRAGGVDNISNIIASIRANF